MKTPKEKRLSHPIRDNEHRKKRLYLLNRLEANFSTVGPCEFSLLHCC